MPKLKIVCSGYAKADGTVVKCGRTIGHQDIDRKTADNYRKQGIPLVSHGMCQVCYNKQIQEARKEK